MTPVTDPTLRHERALGRQGARLVIGVDEVGRGALAGPVAVGMCVIDPLRPGRIPKGLRDSKLLAEPRREQLAPLAARWARASAVGLASANEVDELGIMACLGIAGARAFETLLAAGFDVSGSVLVLDGNYDYLTRHLGPASETVRVTTRIKADRDCASVSAASVVAKVHRDRLMIALDAEVPGYKWASNKGYASTAHFEALDLLGPSAHHRHTWLKTDRMLALFDDAESLDAADAGDAGDALKVADSASGSRA